MKRFFLCYTLLVIIWPLNISAFDNKVTHKDITLEAVEESKLFRTTFLKDKLNFVDGIDTVINKQTITKWLQYGSEAEDYMLRASNHFHNPLRTWNVSGARDFLGTPHSNILWATGYLSHTEKTMTDNEWNWDKAREYYYAYLTATTKIARESNLSKSLRALGQVVHLLQDMAVPAHTRDNFMSHMEIIKNKLPYFGDYYEYWVENHPGSVRNVSPHKSGISKEIVAGFWDTDIYNGGNPGWAYLDAIGLAEYTNSNFASKDTIFTESLPLSDVYYHPYPARTSTNLPVFEEDGTLPETITDKDGVIIKQQYIKKIQDGEIIDHFVKPTYFTDHLQDMEGNVLYRKSFIVDSLCAEDYAKLLIPRAIGYSADLIDYFFKGIAVWPGIELIHSVAENDDPNAVVSSNVVKIRAWLKNESPDIPIGDSTGETMGTIVGIAQYKLSANGETIYAVSAPKVINPLYLNTVYPNFNSSNTYDQFIFDFSSDPIPASVADLRFQVVYKGTIGGEKETGIAVGMLPAGQIIDIVSPDRFVYALTDGVIKTGKTEQEFTNIKAKVSAFLPTALAQGGQLTVVVYYRKWPGYRADLDPSIYPPTQGDMLTVTSAPVTLDATVGKAPKEITFDFTNSPIPVGITDLTLEIQYRTPGLTLVARGAKDLFEPTHVAVINSTDYFYLNQEIYSNVDMNNKNRVPSLFNQVDLNHNRKIDCGEPYINSFNQTHRFLFRSVSNTDLPPFNDTDYELTYDNVSVRKHLRFIYLAGAPWVKIWNIVDLPKIQGCDLNQLHWEFALTNQSVKTQWDEEPRYVWALSKRGINAHHPYPYLNTYPTREGYAEAPWPGNSNLTDLNPFPATYLKP
jgi:hypothetical protein